MRDQDVVVVGAGVSGLTTAVLLAEAGARVSVLTREPPLRTTSVAAGAIWGPYLVKHPRAIEWSQHTLRELQRLSAWPGSGVEMATGMEAALADVAPPEWVYELPGFAMCGARELPPGRRTGWRFSAPIVDMPVYLRFLTARLKDSGGRLEITNVRSLSSLAEQGAVVVNCTGLGARELVPDPRMEAVRGELVVVENPGVTEFFLEHEEEPPHLTYYFPHGETVILGGTAEDGKEHLSPDPGTAEAIIRRCAEFEPRLEEARIIQRRVGVRPTLPVVRVERDDAGVIHNYGHGGSGVTLSWGCARDVVELVSHQPSMPVMMSATSWAQPQDRLTPEPE